MSSEPPTRAADLLAAGLVSRPDAVAEIRETVGDPRSGPGGRALRITMAGGVSVEVLPERGLDLGSLWYANQPVAWRSALEARGRAADPMGQGWIGRFGGGLLVTCGVDNIGPAREGMDLHGSHHLTAAVDVAVLRGADGSVTVQGVVDSAKVFGRQVYVHRSVVVAADRPEVFVRDRIVNDGSVPAPVPLLYHVNFGAPFLMPGATVHVPAERHVPRDDVSAGYPWEAFPEPTPAVLESVWEHSGLTPDAAGTATASVASTTLGLAADVSWDAAALPRCIQWIYPSAPGWALGVEPANAPIFGADRDAPHAGAPVLAPGGSLEVGVRVALRPL